MANAEQLALLKAGVEGWNEWRKSAPEEKINFREANLERRNLSGVNLSGADLHGANLRRADLERADLRGADLRRADLFQANLRKADLREAKLREAKVRQAHLEEADLRKAILLRTNLSEAHLEDTNLRAANLRQANLSEAHLERAKLEGAILHAASLVETNLEQANLTGAHIYGIAAWNLKLEGAIQSSLVITREHEPIITVDNIKVAQFIYLILNNKEIRDVINTLTSKTVLILGRFAIPERKAILDALRDKLREYDLLPIVFDFDRPTDKDFTETIKTLAGISYFVIADVTNPKSSPLELQATIPDYQIPFVPIIQEGEYPFAMMVDLQKKYNWVLDTISYDSLDTLIEILKPHIIDPAIEKRDELRLIKAKEPTIISGRELRKKK